MSDMTIDIFAEQPFGKAALNKMSNMTQNFRLYHAAWLRARGVKKTDTMKVTGAEFRHAKKGINKGKLSVIVKGTNQTVYVNKNEMQEFITA